MEGSRSGSHLLGRCTEGGRTRWPVCFRHHGDWSGRYDPTPCNERVSDGIDQRQCAKGADGDMSVRSCQERPVMQQSQAQRKWATAALIRSPELVHTKGHCGPWECVSGRASLQTSIGGDPALKNNPPDLTRTVMGLQAEGCSSSQHHLPNTEGQPMGC